MSLRKGLFAVLIGGIALLGTDVLAVKTIADTPSVPTLTPRALPKYGGSVEIPTNLPKPTGRATDVPTNTSGNQPAGNIPGSLAYVGPGCDSSEGTKWDIVNGKWQEAIGLGYCKRSHWLTWTREPSRSSPPNLLGSPSSGAAFMEVTSNFMMSWEFFALAQAGTKVSIAVYIPTEKPDPDIYRLSGFVSRRVSYQAAVYNTAKKKFDRCFEKEVDQEQYKDAWVELGTCNPQKPTMVVLSLRDIDPIDKRVNYRMVGDVARFTVLKQ